MELIYIFIGLLLLQMLTPLIKSILKRKQKVNHKKSYENQKHSKDLNIEEIKPYHLKGSLLTHNEKLFYEFMRIRLPAEKFLICPQVAYSALIDKQRIQNKSLKHMFNSYFVDYVICDTNFKPLCAIELDEPNHRTSQDRIERDSRKNTFFKSISENTNGKFQFFRIPYNTPDDFKLLTKNEFYQRFAEVIEFLRSYL